MIFFSLQVIAVLAKIGVMDEGNAVFVQLPGQLSGIGINLGILGMNQRIEAEDKIKRVVSDHVKRRTVRQIF